MIQTLSETVVLPIAGMILTFVLVYELVQMILEKNNMHEFDTFNIFKWVFKTFVATYLLTNCFTIVMAVFDVAQTVVANSAGISTEIWMWPRPWPTWKHSFKPWGSGN